MTTTITYTPEAREALAAYLARPGYKIPKGLGTEEAACSVAAINLAMTGKLTDIIPACMSEVIGNWIIHAQDQMPAPFRNSASWREALLDAPGTGRDRESERLEIILDWMWSTVLPSVQPTADCRGFGKEWQTMCRQRTKMAAEAACKAANKAMENTPPMAIKMIDDAAEAAACAEETCLQKWTPLAKAEIAARAADAAAAGADMSIMSAWRSYNPAGLLRKLIDA